MANLLKRIIIAQKSNVLISDDNVRVLLRKKGDSIDLLSLGVKKDPKFTLEKIAASKSLHGAIQNGDVKLYNEKGEDLSLLEQIKATSLSTLLEAGGEKEEDSSLEEIKRYNFIMSYGW